MKGLILSLACLVTLTSCMGQNFKDRSTFAVDVSQLDRFHLYNRRGAVTVKATGGNTATLEVTRSLKAKSSAKLEEAKKNIYVDSMMMDGELVFFIQHPDRRLEYDEERGFAWYNQRDRDWNWDRNDDDDLRVEFTMTLNIPARTKLVVVNHEHPLKVDGMQADLIARNHHDGVLVENQGGNASVHSHHGDVEVFYTKNPTADCVYDTHHGDIRVHYKEGLSAEASMYSYHGDFFSEFDWSLMPITAAKSGERKGTRYKVKGQGGTNVKIGSGGPLQRFKTHHGDVYLLNK